MNDKQKTVAIHILKKKNELKVGRQVDGYIYHPYINLHVHTFQNHTLCSQTQGFVNSIVYLPYLGFQSYLYIFYTLSLFRRCLSSFSLYPLFDYIPLQSSFGRFSVILGGHSRSLTRTLFSSFYLLGKRGSTEKEKKKRNILARRKSATREGGHGGICECH